MKRSFDFHTARRWLVLVALVSGAAYAVRLLSRGSVEARPPRGADLPAEPVVPTTAPLLARAAPRTRAVARRAALALVLATAVFAAATVSAGAGDDPAKLLEETTETVVPPAEPPEAVPAAEQPPAAQPPAEQPPAEPGAEPAAPPVAPPAESPAESPAAVPATDADSARSSPRRAHGAATKRATHRAPAAPRPREASARPKPTAEQEAEAHGGAAVVWLRRPLPDPTPRARRLDRWFVYDLVRSSRRAGVDWALVLGVVRARGHGGRTPVDATQLEALAERLRAAGAGRDDSPAALAVMGGAEPAEKAMALARYNRAVGTETLVRGLAASKHALVERVLKDGRVEIYAGGRDDLAFGRIDVRVVALISYLAESFGQVTVTSLFSGHGLYARPGVVSAHVYGQAVDVAGLAGLSITGNQAPGGLAEQAVRSILRLPAELQPRQVISLLGLGGPSFPLSDHHDHIHVGY